MGMERQARWGFSATDGDGRKVGNTENPFEWRIFNQDGRLWFPEVKPTGKYRVHGMFPCF